MGARTDVEGKCRKLLVKRKVVFGEVCVMDSSHV